MSGHLRYEAAGAVTAIDDDLVPRLSELPSTPVELCAAAQALVVLSDLAAGLGLPETRRDEEGTPAAAAALGRRYANDLDRRCRVR